MVFALSSAGCVLLAILFAALFWHRRGLSARRLARCAMVAAAYVVLCLAFQPISYGPVQVRLAEALCLLPVFGGEYAAAVTLGCVLANLFGYGPLDALFGGLATLLACLFTWRLRGVRLRGLALPASLPPVIFNAVIVGAELTLFFTDGGASLPAFLWNSLTVGIGEAISCCVLGTALVRAIERRPQLLSAFRQG